MTNKAKFIEVFGVEPDTTNCPIWCTSDEQGICDNYGNPHCNVGAWWDLEYEEVEDGND